MEEVNAEVKDSFMTTIGMKISRVYPHLFSRAHFYQFRHRIVFESLKNVITCIHKRN